MISVRDVHFTPARTDLRDQGVLGWISFILCDAVRVDSVQVRRTSHGRVCISFPHRTDRSGVRHELVAPINADVRWEIERQVLEALDLGLGKARP